MSGLALMRELLLNRISPLWYKSQYLLINVSLLKGIMLASPQRGKKQKGLYILATHNYLRGTTKMRLLTTLLVLAVFTVGFGLGGMVALSFPSEQPILQTQTVLH